jgi:hypothetical protein
MNASGVFPTHFNTKPRMIDIVRIVSVTCAELP